MDTPAPRNIPFDVIVINSFVVEVLAYQQVAVTAETDSRARHGLQVDVRARDLHVPKTAL